MHFDKLQLAIYVGSPKSITQCHICSYLCIDRSHVSLHCLILYAHSVTAFFAFGGIKSQLFMYQLGSDVRVNYQFDRDVPIARWQIHALPVDFTVDAKLRCRPEYVGEALPYSGGHDDFILGVNVADFIMNSVVISSPSVPGALVCGTIVPLSLSYSLVSIDFKSGVIGRIYIGQFPRE